MGLVETLLATYPDVDRMMAETIVKMHEQGKLEQMLSEAVPAETKRGMIKIDAPEEKPHVDHICEDKSAALSSLTPP